MDVIGVLIKRTYSRNNSIMMDKSTNKNEGWQRVLELIMADYPEVLNRTIEEQRAEFDRISDKIAQNLPYDTAEEFEDAMRGRTIVNDIATHAANLQPAICYKGDHIDRSTLT